MNRHEYRIKIVTALYQSLLLKKDVRLSFMDNFEDCDEEFVKTIRDDLVLNKNLYVEEITPYLKKWSFDRLAYIDQAIILLAMSELKTGLNNKNIVIDEAINIAKEYSDEESYKYINGVLDNL